MEIGVVRCGAPKIVQAEPPSQRGGGRCANPVTYSSTKSVPPNTASGGTTARSK